MNLTFWGAAQQVTGSMHLLEIENYRILIDCGLDYERDTKLFENEFFPFDPSKIDVVLLTHAHIDHSGNLPTLIKHGFQGQIICTPPTAELAELLLFDSVNIFLSNKNKKNKKKRASSPPLYAFKHVQETIDRFITVSFNKVFKINKDIDVEFIPVGHVLGASSIILSIKNGTTIKKIGFTGDIGRKNYPVLQDPQNLPQVDYLISESTYGGRIHSEGNIEDKLIEIITETCIKNPGRLIIPAFSIGRTQSLIFTLNKIFTSKKLPPVKVFVDSPMANHATTIYKKHQSLLSKEAFDFYETMGDEFDFDNLSYVQNLRESKEVSSYLEPCIIVSSAGMLEGGRIQDHLFYNIQNYYCTILFIGYCAKGTLGHRLLRGDPIVNLRNRELSVFATIKQTDLLSGHGDHNDLIALIKNQEVTHLTELFLVHGDPSSLQALQESARNLGYKTTIAEKGITYELK